MSLSSISEAAGYVDIIKSVGSNGLKIKEIHSDRSKGKKIQLDKPLSLVSKSASLAKGVLSQFPTTSTSHLDALTVLGPVAPIIALSADTLTLGAQSKELGRLRKELDELPHGSDMRWARQVLEARIRHAEGMVKNSIARVAADSLSVAGSFIPIIGGIPATIVGGSVSMIKFLAERELNSELRNELEKIAEDYSSSHPGIIKHHKAFKELHETLKSQYEQAVTKKEKAEKVFEDVAIANAETGGQRFTDQLSQAAKELLSAETALKDLTKHLEDHKRSKTNFDAYSEALLIIHSLEPKEAPIDQRELGSFTDSRFSSFGGTESLGFSPVSEFSSEYVTKTSVGVTKAQRGLKEIGITPRHSQKQKASETEKQPKETPKDVPELGWVTNSRFSAFGGAESFGFSTTSEFYSDGVSPAPESSEYVKKTSVGVAKTQRVPEKIEITPRHSQKQKASKTEREPKGTLDTRDFSSVRDYRLSTFTGTAEALAFS